jgi:peptidoglycan/xylan/chitin deacetylase (PgdA/CDA1 family)
MGAILGFHSVTTTRLPADGAAHVSLESFKTFVRIARALGEIVPMGELVRRHQRGMSTSGLIALTFDDAYAALNGEFRQYVSREAIPIAIFVATQASDAGAPYWWDRIDDAFPRVSPDRWRAFEIACGLPDQYRQGQPAELGPLRPLRQWLLATYAGRWPNHLDGELAALENDAGRETLHRAMTFDELAELASLPSVEIGVHTVSHPVLPLLADDELRREIVTSYDALRSTFTAVLPVLAIPFALYDDRTLRIARSAGMTACLTLAGTPLDADRHALSRLCVTKNDTPLKLSLRLLGLPQKVRRCLGGRPVEFPELPSATT